MKKRKVRMLYYAIGTPLMVVTLGIHFWVISQHWNDANIGGVISIVVLTLMVLWMGRRFFKAVDRVR